MNRRFLGQWQEDDSEGYTSGFDEDTMRLTTRPPAPDHNSGALVNGKPVAGEMLFGSAHPGGFNAVFADGSVHFISYGIDPTVFSRLGDRSDGQVIPADSFQ
jgi:prepilin-type processing-associated H-X9-DG protein